MAYILVIDIGKTHVKLHILDDSFNSILKRETANPGVSDGPYPHFNTESIWAWLRQEIGSLRQRQEIETISITTHGACAALIDRDKYRDGLVLPILDYEYPEISSCNSQYDPLRPDFTKTLSPNLPAGLNLGRQLFWLQANFPEQFAEATDILMYPQYWAWRFSGNLYTEVTSLGCHTDLWEPQNNCYSSLASSQGWEKLFPPRISAWQSVGCVSNKLAVAFGLSKNCKVYAGVHDSNASYLRYLPRVTQEPFSVVSTGTWTIVMSSGTSLEKLDSNRDMLANVDINGRPVACSRSMGGREFERICQQLNSKVSDPFSTEDVQKIIDAQLMALPNFSDGSGPFPNAKSSFTGETSNHSGCALATLYCALLIDYQLDLLEVQGTIFIEGSFLKNTELCSILAQLRENQKVLLSADATGTVQGCAMLTQWEGINYQVELSACPTSQYTNLIGYRDHWRSLMASS